WMVMLPLIRRRCGSSAQTHAPSGSHRGAPAGRPRPAPMSVAGQSVAATACKKTPMRLSAFITSNLEEILVEWEAFAASLLAPGQVMTSLALRDHATQILLAIAEDIESKQTDLEQAYKSKGFVPIAEATRTA